MATASKSYNGAVTVRQLDKKRKEGVMPTIKIFKFFEYLWRMGSIIRWSLMRNERPEDLKQHSFDVATLVHLLVTIRNTMFPELPKLDAGKAVSYALFHDATEVFTGDVPTPIKYFGGGAMKRILAQLEGMAINKMVSSLPNPMQPAYREVLNVPAEYELVLKAADQLSALRKCQDELAAGNKEFTKAHDRIKETLATSSMPEVRFFMANFLADRPMSLDELIEGNGAWLLETD